MEENPLYFVCDDQCIDGRFDADNCGRCGKVCDQSDTRLMDCRAREIGGCLGEFITSSRTRCSTFCPQAVAPGGQCTAYEDAGRAMYANGSFQDVACDEVPPAQRGRDDFEELHCYCRY